MTDENVRLEKGVAEGKTGAGSEPVPKRALNWTLRVWRPAGTVVAVALAMLLTWHVINGKHGLQVWHQKRAEDQQLRKEIDELQQENARLRDHIERLKSDPDAIEHEAREKLHYAKPGEVIYTLPAPAPAPVAGSGK
jgi:cell division protein FtsB